MISHLPFDWFVLLLRVVFIFLLYFFLFQVIRVILRELRAFSSEPRAARSAGAAKHSASSAAEPYGHLVVKAAGNSGLRPGSQLDLEPVTVIGRHPLATIRVDDEFVSSEHVQLVHQDGSWWITDLGSTNGTLVNGREVTRQIGLSEGDVIEIGDVKLQMVR